jgi:hypothetical protein
MKNNHKNMAMEKKNKCHKSNKRVEKNERLFDKV